MAPVIAFTAVVDRTDSGLPDSPLRLIEQGRINTAPNGQRLTVILGSNKDEFAFFLNSIKLVIPGLHLPVR